MYYDFVKTKMSGLFRSCEVHYYHILNLAFCDYLTTVILLISCIFKERNKNQRVRFKNEVDILRSLEDVNSCSNIFCFYGYCEDESKKQNYHEYNHVLRKWDDYYMLKVNLNIHYMYFYLVP